MPKCPVCDQDQQADDAALQHHVNSHFENPTATSGQILTDIADREETEQRLVDRAIAESLQVDHQHQATLQEECFICGTALESLSPVEKEIHVNVCLDGASSNDTNPEARLDYVTGSPLAAGQLAGDNTVDSEWDGPAKPGNWTDWVSRKVDKGDVWWDPVTGDPLHVPSNFSPNVIPILVRVLSDTVKKRITRSAVLSKDVIHIRGSWGFDLGWGCGYRNALMAISSLVLAMPEYRHLFARERNGSDPGVRRVQGWIEEAWAAGFDQDGKEQLKGRVLGTRKWIGTSDLYCMFSYLGIPCKLYDFPRPAGSQSGRKATHQILQQWVKRYFAEDLTIESKDSAYDILMRSGDGGQGRGEPIRVSARFPLILQHSGHSRTIVGYEENSRGDVNLLLFDPGKTVPKDIRAAGLSKTHRSPSTLPRLDTSKNPSNSHEPMEFSPPFTNGASEIISLTKSDVSSANPANSNTAMNKNAKRRPESSLSPSDEEMNDSGWVRKKIQKVSNAFKSDQNQFQRSSGSGFDVEGSAVKALNRFRLNLGLLNTHTEYQVLAFTGGALLSPREREKRKITKSIMVRE